MGRDTTYETYISVNEPIEVIAGILGAPLLDSDSPEGPVRRAEIDVHPVRFTFFSHRDNPGWSHLLSSVPFDEDQVAEFLSTLGVQESSIDVVLDYDSQPLQDVDSIREKVALCRTTMRH